MTLSVYRSEVACAEIADVLGMLGDEAHEPREPTKAHLARPARNPYSGPRWSWRVPDELIDPTDEMGFGSVRALVMVFADKVAALARLRPDCDTVIWWSGDSDSSQGGFVLPG